MAQKTLNAYVVISGKVDNSFTELGQAFLNLGGHIDEISQKLINFGKESVQTYQNYEDSMLEAETALATKYGKGSQALKEVMKDLDTSASEWAANSIFHTDDVANAINKAAHANWDLEKILEGMPAAMRLAQAGGLDLSTGLDFIIKSTNAAQISFSDLSEWVDEWTYAANNSAGDVEQFGEAMLRMGATMRFADNKEELLTMLGVLHDAGTVGSNAGTLLRNTLIRLISPTKKAKDAMEELEITQEDIDEAMGEVTGDTAAAMERLKEAGFSVYKTGGQLKDFTEIFEDLNAATANMTEEEKYDIWSALFPTRTITGAMALMNSAGNNWNGLLDDLNGGAAEGYGKYAAETMMSGLTGSIETFLSKVEDLKKEIGQNLSPEVKTIEDNLGKVIDKIRAGGKDNGVSSGLDWLTDMSGIVGDLADNIGDMDTAVFDALVAGLGEIAVAGPVLTIAGFGLRGIGSALSLFTGSAVGRLVLAGLAISLIARTMAKFNEAKFLENFGDLTIDTTNLDASMGKLKNAFEIAREPAEQFAKALDDSVKNYEAASETFSATMMEDLLKDQTLTGDEREKKLNEYKTLGEDMVKYLKDGITSKADMSAEFWLNVFTGKNETPEDAAANTLYQGILRALDTEKSDAMTKAEDIGRGLREAITKAWEDGHLDEAEREKIKAYFEELNAAMAEAEAEAATKEQLIQRKEIMRKAQGLNYSQMQEYMEKKIIPQRQKDLDYFDSRAYREIFEWEIERDALEATYKDLVSQGNINEARRYAEKITALNLAIHGGKQGIENKHNEIYSDYDSWILSWYQATLGDSAPAALQAAALLANGQITDISALGEFVNGNGIGLGDLLKYSESEIATLGGIEEINRRIAAYTSGGNTGMAEQLTNVLALYAIASGNVGDLFSLTPNHVNTAADFEAMYRSGLFGNAVGSFMQMLTSGNYGNETLQEYLTGIRDSGMGTLYESMVQAFAGEYDIGMINAMLGNGSMAGNLADDYAMALLMGMSESERSKYRYGSQEYNPLNADILVPEAEEAAEAARKQMEDVFAEPLTQQVFIEYVSSERGFTDASGGKPLNFDFDSIEMHAQGGRGTKPSIFAEAGIPEWFIPEEHTANTGRLLLAAMASSGFDLIELAAMSGARMFAEGGTTGALNWGSLAGSGSGGGGSSGGGSGIQVQYSPVIHADNAAGVARALKEDKERLARWFDEFMERREMYESMVAYR